ncbi:MAG: response regulator [Ramlibacter sp.]|nr:response regulator [Ramlibacter sp.]
MIEFAPGITSATRHGGRSLVRNVVRGRHLAMWQAGAAPTLQERPPALFAMQSTPPVTLPSPGEPRRECPRVALCEPDTLLGALLAEWLHRAGFEPVRCGIGDPVGNVVLVVADVPAPRADGAACIAHLRRAFPGARVLAISAQFAPGLHGANCTAAAELGVDAVLAKPFAVKAFVDTVHAALRRST